MVSNDHCAKALSIRLRFLQNEHGIKGREGGKEREGGEGEMENVLEKRTRITQGHRPDVNQNENAEPIGARSRVQRKIDNVVRRIPNPLHRFFNPICRSFAARIPTESIACEPFAAIRPTSARQRIE